MSGNPQDSGKIRGHRFTRLPAGRAVLLDDGDAPEFLQLVNPFADEGAVPGGSGRPGHTGYRGREFN